MASERSDSSGLMSAVTSTRLDARTAAASAALARDLEAMIENNAKASSEPRL
jgi:hypothetical protein